MVDLLFVESWFAFIKSFDTASFTVVEEPEAQSLWVSIFYRSVQDENAQACSYMGDARFQKLGGVEKVA